MTDELKPCPFCGGEAHMPYYGDRVECRECKGSVMTIAAWNTRADDARISALEQRVRELEEALKPFAFLEMEKAEGLADTQYVWEAIYLDRVQDWIAFEDIDTARKALG